MTTTKHEIRSEDGRFAVGYETPCTCGHTKGEHAAGRRGDCNGHCVADLCECEKFKKAK
jgi:hypothetical protein